MSLNHRETRTPLKDHDEIIASIGENPPEPQEFSRSELDVYIHHMAGMTISLDRNEALALLAFLKQHERALIDAPDPEAL